MIHLSLPADVQNQREEGRGLEMIRLLSKVGNGKEELFTACDTCVLSQFTKHFAVSSQAPLKGLVMKC